MAQCPICDLAVTNPTLYRQIAEIIEGGRATGGIPAAITTLGAKGMTASKVSMEKHFGRRKNHAAHKVTIANQASEAPLLRGNARMELAADGSGLIETAETFDEAVDWDSMVAMLGGDPATTQVKMDTIRVSARTIVYTDDDGNVRERIARSYSAALTPRDPRSERTFDAWEKALTEIRAAMRTPITPPKPRKNQPTSAFLVAFGDMQIGKSEGNGIEGVLTRIFDAVERSIESYQQNVAMGERYHEVVLAQMGDIVEGVMGNYANQLHTVKLNKTDQEDLAMEVLTYIIERYRAEVGLPITLVTVNSNHGEQSRGGGNKNLTSASDTVDRRLALDLQRFYELMEANGVKGPKVRFITPSDNLVVPAVFAGVNMAFAHGHGIGARAKATTIQQELLMYDKELTETNGGVPFLPQIWITAHYHHFMVQDVGPYTWIQTPALDGGSAWFTNMSGNYSRPGLLTASIGSHHEGGIDLIRPLWVKDTPTPVKTTAKERVAHRKAHS